MSQRALQDMRYAHSVRGKDVAHARALCLSLMSQRKRYAAQPMPMPCHARDARTALRAFDDAARAHDTMRRNVALIHARVERALRAKMFAAMRANDAAKR